MMLRLGDDGVAARSLAVDRNPFAAVMYFHLTPALTHPHLSARIRPRHGVAAALPGNVCIARDLAQLVVDIRIGRASIEWLQVEPIRTPPRRHLLVCRAMHALVRYFPHPGSKLRVQIIETARLAS